MKLLENWIDEYNPRNHTELFNAKREIVQEVILAGLYRGSFFEHAAFYGGTALRILYGLDRFSEDLDFSLLASNPNFTLEEYFKNITEEFNLLGLDIDISNKKKVKASAVESAFLKDNSEWTFVNITDVKKDQIFPKVKIKIEVDRNPPLGFQCESVLLNRPYMFYVNTMKIEDLYAGKMHALLFRKWGNNVKGRDWYDLLWYISNGYKFNLDHFKNRAVASGEWDEEQKMTLEDVLEIYINRVDQLDITQAKSDIARFISDQRKLDIWSTKFFQDVKHQIKIMN